MSCVQHIAKGKDMQNSEFSTFHVLFLVEKSWLSNEGKEEKRTIVKNGQGCLQMIDFMYNEDDNNIPVRKRCTKYILPQSWPRLIEAMHGEPL